jgi:hypothetical protein
MSEPLSPAAMAALATTPKSLAPRAISHFGLAAMEARATRIRAASSRLAAMSSKSVSPESMSLGSVTRPADHPVTTPAPRTRRYKIRLWLPLTAIFLLLAPFALLFAPIIWLCTPPSYRTPPLATALGLGRLLLSLGGTVVHVEAPEGLVSIRIF